MSRYVGVSCTLKPLCRPDHGTPNRTFLTCRERFKIFVDNAYPYVIHLEISGKKNAVCILSGLVFMVSGCYCNVKVHFTFFYYKSLYIGLLALFPICKEL